MRRLAQALLWIVAVFYAYGAIVHIANMFSLSGFDWFEAPLKWQVLDVVYLVLSAMVAFLLPRRTPIGIGAFGIAATSQLVLYTALRDWILDVPAAFAPTPDQISYLDGLVIFHVVSVIVVSYALWTLRPQPSVGT